MKSSASAVWNGSLKDGNGKISTTSGALDSVPYSFLTRFEGAKGLNPEELIAAAHASCFSMAFSAELGKSSITPTAIYTTATVVLDKKDNGFAVTESNLVTTISAPGSDEEKIRAAAAGAKENCPISKLLNAKISLDLKIN
jgi:osmotically inducible protein OsmC